MLLSPYGGDRGGTGAGTVATQLAAAPSSRTLGLEKGAGHVPLVVGKEAWLLNTPLGD